MGFTGIVLEDVRQQLAPDDTALKEARERRDAAMAAAATFRGALRTFRSGSLAHGTANCPVHERDKGLDADCGGVLDRRTWVHLGPDSEIGEGPNEVVIQMRDHLQERLRSRYPQATYKITKRAILINFHEPLPSGEDPTVDLVVGLTRAAGALWIPNTERNTWDPSDPETHTDLLTARPKALLVSRARAVRLAKAENKRHPTPLLCSFNLEAFGLMFVRTGMTEVDALAAIWEGGSRDLQTRLTPDPAGVSGPIKCEDRPEAAARLAYAAGRLRAALAHDSDERSVRRSLAELWPEFVAVDPGGSSKARIVAASRSGGTLSVAGAGLLSVTSGSPLKAPRSFGD